MTKAAYYIQPLTRGCFQCQGVRVHDHHVWEHGSRQTGRLGAAAVADSLDLYPQTAGRETNTGLGVVFET